MKRSRFSYIVLGLLFPWLANAQVPTTISYQGRMDSAGVPIKSPKNLSFGIYSAATGGTALWTESQSSVPFTSGVFSVRLGSVTPFPATLFTSAGERWLGVTLSGASEMTPRFLFTTSPYALRALRVDSIADNAITGAKIADGAVGTSDVADNAITSAKILDGTIATADMADNAVTAAKLAASAVTSAKIADEPGVAQAKGDPNTLQALTSSGQAMISVTLNAPAAGYALVMGSFKAFISHVVGAMDNVIAKLSTTSGDVTTPSSPTAVVRVPSSWPTGGDYFVAPACVMYIFPVSAGSTTFYLNIVETSSTGNDAITTPNISVVYLPTAYGAVATLLQSGAGGTGFTTDLNK